MRVKKGQSTYRLPERGGTVLNVVKVGKPYWVIMQPGVDWVQHKFSREIHFYPTPRKGFTVHIRYMPPERSL